MKTNIWFLFLIVFSACSNSNQTRIDYGANEKTGKYMEVNDIKVYYEVYGKGEPLILIHGNSSSIVSFENQIPELSKHYQLIAVDSRAQGKSTDSKKEITYELMASDVYELIKKLNLDSVFVLGHSDGGIVGLELAYAHPEKVKKLIAIGANYSWKDFLELPDSIQMSSNDPLIERIRPLAHKIKEGAQKITPEIQKKLTDLMDKYPNFTTDQLHKIKTPVLVVSGDHDLITLEHTISLFSNLSNAQLLVLPDATHFVMMEQADILNKQIIKFFDTPFRNLDGYYFMKTM